VFCREIVVPETEATRLALEYVVANVPWARHEVLSAMYLPAQHRPELDAKHDAWSFYFPRILSEGVESEEPSVVVVHVDVATHEVILMRML